MRTLINVVLFLMVASSAVAEEAKFGFVNMRRAVTESQEGVKAFADLQKEKEIKQGLLDDKQKRVVELQKALETQGGVMAQAAKETKIRELQKEAGEAQQLLMTLQNEMGQREQQMVESILSKMNPLINAMGKDGKYTMIFSEGVVYAPAHSDLTNEVIRKFNESYKKPAAPAKKAPSVAPAKKIN